MADYPEAELFAYFCNSDDQVHLIVVDLAWSPPVPTLPYWLRLTAPAPPIDVNAPPGSHEWMCSPAVREQIGRARQALYRASATRPWFAEPQRRVFLVGEDYRAGEVRIHFRSEMPIETRWLDQMGEESGFECDASFGEDSAWLNFRDLHPGEALTQLRLSRAQRAEFVAQFPSEWRARTYERDDGERRFVVDLSAQHSLTRPKIDSMVVALISYAAPLRGEYDGWGAHIVPAE